MRVKLRWLLPLLLIVILAGVYFYPVPNKSFEEFYANVDAEIVASLVTFRQAHPLQTLVVDGVNWEYVSIGDGPETILFLHGMTGAYDIWWQQMETLQQSYRVISVTYPSVNSLGDMEKAVLSILASEGVSQFHVVGSSLGGYFAQFLVAQNPDMVLSAVFANTFPPNEVIAENNKAIGAALPYLPEWLILNVLRGSMQESVYPASDYSELVLSFGLEQTYGRMDKSQVLGRYRCVVEPFEAPDMAALGIPVLIIEADNDPLVEKQLRDQLRITYPSAQVQTLSGAGHFPYLSHPDQYIQILEEFLRWAGQKKLEAKIHHHPEL